MSEDLIRYDVLVSEALRGVVRKVLAEVVKTGLPGEHHFFISFDTRFAGVRVSSSLKARFPEELTIVLQHQFWDLTVNELGFEVGLSFGGVVERLVVPFAAVTGFHDPSVDFALKFETLVIDERGGDVVLASLEEDDGDEDTDGEVTSLASARKLPRPAAARARKKEETPAEPEAPENAEGEDDGDDTPDDDGPKVVSLDAFRKKP